MTHRLAFLLTEPRSRVYSLTFVSALIAVTACRDVEGPPSMPSVEEVHAARSEARKRNASSNHEGEKYLHAMAARIPGFAGFYQSGPEQFTILTTEGPGNGAWQNAARGVIRGIDRRMGDAFEFVHKTARFTFADLADWRDETADFFLMVPGWLSLDLDEANNVLTIGMEAGGDHATAAAVMHASGVPDAAFRIQVEGRPMPNASLGSRHRPLRGGAVALFLTAPGSQNGVSCPIAAVAKRQGQIVLVGASHCGQKTWYQDVTSGPMIAQGGLYETAWGNEVADARPYCNVAGQWWPCRNSDASLYSPNANSVTANGEFAYAFAELLRPLAGPVPGSQAPHWPQTNTTAIGVDPDRHLTITGELPMWQGLIVEKIGPSTGWTSGSVSNTCIMSIWPIYPNLVDAYPGYGRLNCQARADYESDPGDSGGPVFNGSNGSVSMVGMNVGEIVGTTTAIFSTVAGMRQDLGSTLQFYDPNTIDWVVGPSTIQELKVGQWRAHSQSPSCQWKVNGNIVQIGSCTYKTWFPLGEGGSNRVIEVAGYYMTSSKSVYVTAAPPEDTIPPVDGCPPICTPGDSIAVCDTGKDPGCDKEGRANLGFLPAVNAAGNPKARHPSLRQPVRKPEIIPVPTSMAPSVQRQREKPKP